jgi:hypothetical protein
VELGKNASGICVMLSEAYRGESMKKNVFLSDINGSKRVVRMWKMMKDVAVQNISQNQRKC